MTEKPYPGPRWWLLYVSLPLAVLLFWLIERAHPADGARRALDMGAVLITFGYIRLWLRANTVALLHHPLDRRAGQPLYNVREITPGGRQGPVAGRHPAPAYTFYSDLFTLPVRVAEPASREIDEAVSKP